MVAKVEERFYVRFVTERGISSYSFFTPEKAEAFRDSCIKHGYEAFVVKEKKEVE